MVAVFDKTNPQRRLRCSAVSALSMAHIFLRDGGMLSLIEQGWIPYAWREDDLPSRDDEKFPPLWTDYLTKPSHD